MAQEKNEDRFKWLGNYTNDLRKDKSFFIFYLLDF